MSLLMMSHRMGSTEELALRAKSDPLALRELLRRLRGRLKMWISLRMEPALRSRTREEEVLRDTLLHASRRLVEFHDTGEHSFLQWLVELARERLNDSDGSGEPPAPASDSGRAAEEAGLLRSLAGTESPDSLARSSELRERLVPAIGRLSAKLRQVLILRAIECRSHAEIACLMDCEPSAVHADYVGALRSLRNELS